MNQKFIISFSVALMLLVPVHAGARSVKADAGVYQNAPTITVKGVVTDTQGEPLPGASVMIQGTSTGTAADIDGNYSITARQGQTIVVSFIGFKEQTFTVTKTQQNIALESNNVLDDVVVVGYGSAKRVNLTGAVHQVSNDLIEARPVSNVEQMLSGAVPNLSIPLTDGAPYRTAGATQIGIRGSGSIGGINVETDAGTLILIDGVEGDLDLINPNDIESITILKDASSAAIYGSRGGYGVILVTTKDAKETSDKTKITYSGTFAIGTPRNLPDFVTDGAEFANIVDQAYYNFNGKHSTVSNLQPVKVDPQTYAAAHKAWHESPSYVPGQNTYVDPETGAYSYYGNTNWYDLMYKPSTFTQIHNLDVKGNTGKTQYSISGRFYDYSGLYQGTSDPYKTFNVRAKINTQITPWLKIGENMEYTYDKVENGVSTAGKDLSTPEKLLATYGPTWEPYNPDGTWTKAGISILGGLMGPYAEYNYKNKITSTFKTTTTAKAEFFDKTLSLNADFSYRTKTTDVTSQSVIGYYSDSEGVLTPQVAPKSATNLKDAAKAGIKEQFRWDNNIVFNAYAQYENTFANKHYFKAMLGYNYENKFRRDFSVRKRGLMLENADQENTWLVAQGMYEDLEDGKGFVDGAEVDNKINRYRNAGMFFRFNYIFDERYLLEVSGRYDGTSRFATGYQWNFFPSVSAGWRVSQEHWWHVNPMIISNLKFRASYGQLGDAMSAGAYNFEETFDPDGAVDNRIIDGSSNTRGYKYPSDFNSAYSWATIKTQNYGVDVSFLKSKLEFTYDYYIRRITDMLVPGVSQPEPFGSESAIGNYGASSTYGWELTAAYHDTFMVGGKPFEINVRAALSNNFTVVDRYDGNDEARIISAGNYRSGEELGEIWGFRSNGIFQNQEQIDNAFGQGKPYVQTLAKTRSDKSTKPGDIWIKDLNNSGKIEQGTTEADPGDMEIIGNKYAKLPFSFAIDLDYRNFFLSLAFQGVMHQDASLDGKHVFWGSYQASNYPVTKWLVNNSWTPENPNAIMPQLATGNEWFKNRQNVWSTYINQFPIDTYVFNVGYINLQNVQFGYNIPKKVLKKVKISALKVYFSGENLWNWSPFYRDFGHDFDVTTITYGGDDYNWGLNWWGAGGGLQYPKLRTYSFGIQLTF